MQALESSILLDPAVVPEYAAPFISAGVPFKETAIYLHVGELVREQGWILHLSVVLGKYFELMEVVLPELLSMGVVFKVVKNSEIHEAVNNGEYGEGNVGKVFSIFLPDELANPYTITTIQEMTKNYQGPKIYSAFRVGQNLYIRYGSYVPNNGVGDYGGLYPMFMNKSGKWLRDEPKIPPELSPGIFNPYKSLMSAWPSPIIQNPLRGIYSIEDTISSTLALVVYSGKMNTPDGRVVPCRIKRAKKNMLVNKEGKDEAYRLELEYKTMMAIIGKISAPQVFDFWMDEDNAFLITSSITGRSLDKVLKDIIADQTWTELPDNSREKVANYFSGLKELFEGINVYGLSMTDCLLHEFIVDSDDNISLIDFKSIKSKYKEPQSTIEGELSRLFISIFTNLPYPRLCMVSESQLQGILLNITHEKDLSIILQCHISKVINNGSVLNQLQTKKWRNDLPMELSSNQILEIIQLGLNGLASEKQLINNLWYTSVDNKYDPETYHFSNKHTFINLNNGVGGVLYTLCYAKKCGFAIDQLSTQISSSWDYINNIIGTNIELIKPGLYNGLSGIAVLYSTATENEMLKLPSSPSYFDIVHKCLLQENLSNHISNGLAGDGIAVIHFAHHSPYSIIKEKLDSIAGHLLRAQQGDGSWAKMYSSRLGQEYFTGFGSGAAGIIYFLLEIWKRYAYEQAFPVALKGLDFLTNKIIQFGNKINLPTSNLDKQPSYGFQEGGPGIALAFLKSFEYTGQRKHLFIAEQLLKSIARYNFETNLTLMDGLAGIGEVYLEAFRITQNAEWIDRAKLLVKWICSLFIREHKERLYWLTSSQDLPFGTLMQGNCGILHFLIRYLHPNLVPLPFMLPLHNNYPTSKI